MSGRGSGWEAFKRTPLGRKAGAIIEHRDSILVMTAFSDQGMPAVQPIGKQLMALGPEIGEVWPKQCVGRWVREVMVDRGFVPKRKGRVPPGNLFSTGMIYERSEQQRAVSRGDRR